MKILPGTLLSVLGAVLLTAFSVQTAEEPDPDTKAALEAAQKAAEKAGVKIPDLKKLMEEAEADDATPKKPAGKKAAAPANGEVAKPAAGKTPLKALPDWIPPITGLKLAPGGKRWTEEDVEHGALSGTAPGAPREVADAWRLAAKEVFRGVTINDTTINGALTLTVFASYLKEEQLEHKVELELKPAKGGKISEVKLTYTIGGEP